MHVVCLCYSHTYVTNYSKVYHIPKKMLTHPKNGPFFTLCVPTAKTWNYAFSGTPTRTLDVVHFVISHIRKYANFSPVHPCTHCCVLCVHVIIIMHACHSLSFMCASKKIKCVHYMLLKTSIFSHLPVPTSKTRNFTISGTPTSTFDGVQIFIWWTRNVWNCACAGVYALYTT